MASFPSSGGALTCQTTPAFEFCTVAANCSTWFVAKLAVLGEMLMLTEGATIVRLVLPDIAELVASSAVSVTTEGLGMRLGAV